MLFDLLTEFLHKSIPSGNRKVHHIRWLPMKVIGQKKDVILKSLYVSEGKKKFA